MEDQDCCSDNASLLGLSRLQNSLYTLCIAVVALMASPTAVAQTYYTVTDLTADLSSIPCQPGVPTSINNNGMVVGQLMGCRNGSIPANFQGYSVTPGSDVAGVTFCAKPVDLNESNTVVGLQGTIDSLLTVVGPSYGCYQPYATYYVQYQSIEAVAINSRGNAVANMGLANGGTQQTTLLANGQIIPLGTPPGTTYTRAFDLNDAGAIAGAATNSACTVSQDCAFAVVYENGAWQDLRLRIGPVQSYAKGINNAGQILGQAYPDIASGSSRSVAWVLTGNVKVDIPALAQNYVTPLAINDFGVVIGSSGLSGQVPLVYSAGQSFDLNTLIAAGSGWTVLNLIDINDKGQIIAVARDSSGTSRSVRLDPTIDNPFPRWTAPVAVTFSTYLGGAGGQSSQSEFAYAVDIDASGAVYVGGRTDSGNFPTVNPLQPQLAGTMDGFVTRLSRQGQVTYSTYLGGQVTNPFTGGGTQVFSVAAASDGSLFVVGTSGATTWPTLGGRLVDGGFLLRLDAAGSQIEFLNDQLIAAAPTSPRVTPSRVRVAPDGNIVVSGSWTFNFGSAAANTPFIAKYTPLGVRLWQLQTDMMAMGSEPDDFAFDSDGNIYVVGAANAGFVPSDPLPNLQMDDQNTVIVRVSPDGAVLNSTVLGGAPPNGMTGFDQALGIGVLPGGDIITVGSTTSTNFPTTAGVIAQTFPSGTSAAGFITRLRFNGAAGAGANISRSTFLPAGYYIGRRAVAFSASGEIWLAGTPDQGFVSTNPLFNTGTAFIASITPDLSSFRLSTRFGGTAGGTQPWAIAANTIGEIAIAGGTTASNYPTSRNSSTAYPSFQTALGGGLWDAFTLKLAPATDVAPPPPPTDSDSDGIPDATDNCPNVANLDQANLDGDSLGDACDTDIDGDGMPNAWETANGFDPRNPADASEDADTDGLTNLRESGYLTNPRNADTDGDGVADSVEVRQGTDPLNPADFLDTSAPPAPNVFPFGIRLIPFPPCDVVAGPRARNLVLIVHGWQETLSLSFGIPSWVTDTAADIRSQINLSSPGDQCNWDVRYVDWFDQAVTAFPAEAFARAEEVALTVYPIFARQYQHVHLIGHSAGSRVIDVLAQKFKSEPVPPTVHETFLDAYHPNGNDNDYGCRADYAESYVDMRSTLRLPFTSLDMRNTNLTLPGAFNVDVTKIGDPSWEPLTFSLNGQPDRTLDIVTFHGWPYNWYQGTVGTAGMSYGFALAVESGRTSIPNRGDPGYEPGSRVCLDASGATYVCPPITTGPAPIALPSGRCGLTLSSQGILDLINLFVPNPAAVVTSPTGTASVDTSTGRVTLRTGSPAWIKFNIDLPQQVDTLRFDLQFVSANDASGLLTVFLDNELVFVRSEQTAGNVGQSSGFIPLGTVPAGIHSVAFRLDPVGGPAQSEAVLSNIQLGDGTVQSTPYTQPVIQPTVAGITGNNDWYTSDVALSWAVNGNGLSVTAQTGCDPTSVTADTTGQTFTCSATNAGGTTEQSVTIKRDATLPIATATPAPLPNADGWNKPGVSVHFAGSDATSGIASCSADAVLSAEGLGQLASGTCTDQAGNVSAPATASGINIDATAPAVSASAAPPPGASGWNTSAVTVSFSATDALSGVAANGCDAPVTLATDGSTQSATGSCRDRAGNAGSTTASGINIDRTAPVAAATAAPPPNANGWNNTNVTVSFEGADSMSGSGIANCTPPAFLSAEAAGQSASGSCTDVAGNTSTSVTASGINIDKSVPTITIVTPPSGASYALGAPVLADYSCGDGLSTVANCIGPVARGAAIDTAMSGSKTFTVTAVDRAGNSRSLSQSYSVAGGYAFGGFYWPVKNPPTFNAMKAGWIVPLRWSLADGSGKIVTDLKTFKAVSSQAVSCTASATAEPIGEAQASGQTGLFYNPLTKKFVYLWKTSGSWKGTCRHVTVEFADGQKRYANFKFQ